ncbi:hypothetical protein NDU88_004528 [Pleurodeles waltl]|uniref:Uncharacterized protein n=1 Tax=Pleurodeles waltl TaxID=8319 RepID=A0AAV7QFU9_PLEWA|nr:hypothetical protein NDU88_004528 [Pleurodeles waltl]
MRLCRGRCWIHMEGRPRPARRGHGSLRAKRRVRGRALLTCGVRGGQIEGALQRSWASKRGQAKACCRHE